MAGPSNLIAFGFGSWSSVGYLPTLGMGIGEADSAMLDQVGDVRRSSVPAVDTRRVLMPVVDGRREMGISSDNYRVYK
jgi:hypothetical protein